MRPSARSPSPAACGLRQPTAVSDQDMALEVQQSDVRSIGQDASRDPLQRNALGEHLAIARAPPAGMHILQRRVTPHLLHKGKTKEVSLLWGWVGCGVHGDGVT